RDLSGFSGKQSLFAMATSLGIPMPDKSLLDEYKSCMHIPFQQHPELFLRYAVGDVRVLRKVFNALVQQFNEIEANLNLREKDRTTAETLPNTLGSQVAKTFEKWLYSRAGEYQEAMRFCIHKLGILNRDARRFSSNRHLFYKTIEQYTKPEDLIGVDLK